MGQNRNYMMMEILLCHFCSTQYFITERWHWSQASVGAGNEINIFNILKIFPIYLQAETELRLSQSEFDRQAEITKLLMEGLSQSQTNHVRHLKAFVAAQVTPIFQPETVYFPHFVNFPNRTKLQISQDPCYLSLCHKEPAKGKKCP